MQNSLQKFFLVLILGACVLMPSVSWASLSIVPTLVVIEGRDRFADVNLINTSDETKTYEVRWRFFEMENGTGRYVEKEKSLTDFSVADHVVFTPRRVRLEPNRLQKIRLGLRLKGEPPAPGDYRAHLEFKEVSLPAAPQPAETPGKTVVGININFGFSIPVIYRVGEGSAKAEIGNVTAAYNDKTKHLEAIVPVTRSKDNPYGILGHLFVYKGGKLIGEQKNANIFPEASHRTFNVMLNVDKLDSGDVSVVYMEGETQNETKPQVKIAEKTVRISN